MGDPGVCGVVVIELTAVAPHICRPPVAPFRSNSVLDALRSLAMTGFSPACIAGRRLLCIKKSALAS